MAIIKAENIVKTFLMGRETLHALKGVNLTVEEKELLAIIGKSGSGKTTFMNILGCLDAPTSGQYFIDNINVSHMEPDQLAAIRNKKIGFVFQKFNLLPDMTALENVALPALYAGKSEEEAEKLALDLLKFMELDKRTGHYPTELSGGEQQRVAIARSLINNPSIILADEPTGNLDSVTGEKILQMFKNLNKEKDVTIIIITHDQHVAEETNRIVRLIDGEIVEDKKNV
ncbi:MAG: ABC transporter related protein [candidate division TM6 bacterium GW2011_GWF2_30_66]|jgi:putative ABC transport system ATP-binding protein|nr:MAG: ABC transporter related protein [candidate division TM6 bacterium GW2011_GWF2_30_66]